ncbi:MAG: MauE/DoxX family redox-associated membrane protein [Micromonosporaceae bacterium]
MVLRIILGAVYLGMAVGQLASWREMPAILGAYDAVPAGAVPWLAGGLVVGELVCGVWFLARPRSSALAPVWVYTAVSVVWAGLGVQAQLRGLAVDNCGCFGVYLTQRLSWFVLLQDALLLGYAALLIRSGLRARQPSTRLELEAVKA